MKNKEITLYELMGFIKDDKAPKQICFEESLWEYDESDNDYYSISKNVLLFKEYIKDSYIEDLNDTVELLEENDDWEDICELLDDSRYNFSDKQNGMTKEDRRLLDSNFKTLGETISKIIKNQKYLKEKLESKDESKL